VTRILIPGKFLQFFLQNNSHTAPVPKINPVSFPKIFWKIIRRVRPSQKLIALAFPKNFWKIYTSAKFKKIANVYEIRILRPSRNF